MLKPSSPTGLLHPLKQKPSSPSKTYLIAHAKPLLLKVCPQSQGGPSDMPHFYTDTAGVQETGPHPRGLIPRSPPPECLGSAAEPSLLDCYRSLNPPSTPANCPWGFWMRKGTRASTSISRDLISNPLAVVRFLFHNLEAETLKTPQPFPPTLVTSPYIRKSKLPLAAEQSPRFLQDNIQTQQAPRATAMPIPASPPRLPPPSLLLPLLLGLTGEHRQASPCRSAPWRWAVVPFLHWQWIGWVSAPFFTAFSFL